MTQNNLRWQQRFDNYLNAFAQFEQAVNTAKQRALSDLEKQGLIQAFEFTHELAWNVLKDYLEYQGVSGLIGSRDTSREAFRKNLISAGETWMAMIASRNLTSHTYNKKIADDIIQQIIAGYYTCFVELKNKMQSLITS